MLLVKQDKVKLQRTYDKILYLYPAFNDTFVFLGMLGVRRDCVTHVDKNGKILFQHEFEKPMDSFGMMNDRECIMLQTRSKWYLSDKQTQQRGPCITILDLKTYEFRRTPHYFRNQQTDQSFIKCFADSKFLCIQQDGRYNDNVLKLSYYHYPPGPNDKPFNEFTSTDSQWTYEYISKQANHHSMIAWFKARHDHEWQFRTYDLRDDPNGKFNIYRFNQQIGIPYNMACVQVALTTMWEMTRNKFMLICITNKGQNEINKDLGVIQNNFVCDVETKKIRQAKFSLGEYHELTIDHTYLGSTFMIRTFDFEEGEPKLTPIYYINNQTEQILAEEQWRCSHLYKDQISGIDSNTLISNQYENGDCDWFICSARKVLKPKEITVHWLLELNKDFDEELLHDVVEMTDYGK